MFANSHQQFLYQDVDYILYGISSISLLLNIISDNDVALGNNISHFLYVYNYFRLRQKNCLGQKDYR